MISEDSLSENQFGFRKDKSIVITIQAAFEISTKARRGTDKRREFCALI